MHFIFRLRELLACAVFALGIGAARADHAPVLVVPGRADVPVMINGYDASWGVVEGDWGLYRPGFVSPTVIPAPTALPLAPPARHYFPSFGARPNYGRFEIEPPANRVLPRPAPTFHRDWSTSSDTSVPASDTPPVILAPNEDLRAQDFRDERDRRRREQRRDHHRPHPQPHHHH